ncbi:Short-chain dehydrogenase/reductase SDR [Caballeronia temeraria]|uniref:Short-chain dehydrogenase/reductase SDR n=1 Tax=Caballeronia temeraria TaxID=1777137 RepID=A0A158DY20_9BURK|nr:SDR family oxidoreductase [Caballeronia temeraria]SAK99512.1 Short-chain dehydrogenase/reductase SDR [Caballeronia temeraria]
MEQGQLAGKVAIVTGGGRGLGRAMALGLAAAGADVVISSASDPGEIRQVAGEAGQAPGAGRILAVAADVTRKEDCHQLVEQAVDTFGGLHILVNNAGRGMTFISDRFLTEPTRFWEVNPDTWRMIIDTNVNGPFLMAQAAVPHLLAQRWGRIINITMNHETMRRAGFSPYGPSKAALESETIIWAQDLADTGITVNGLLPGGASATGMIPAEVPEVVRQQLIQPDVMVPPLLWLTSQAAGAVTGKRLVASRWNSALPAAQAAQAAMAEAGWLI